jgi:hypothetical protein
LNNSLNLFSPSPTYLERRISWFIERILTSLSLLIISAIDLINFDFPVPLKEEKRKGGGRGRVSEGIMYDENMVGK